MESCKVWLFFGMIIPVYVEPCLQWNTLPWHYGSIKTSRQATKPPYSKHTANSNSFTIILAKKLKYDSNNKYLLIINLLISDIP